MDREKLANTLGTLGLSNTESEVYLYVSANPESNPGTITKALKIARSKTYDSLNKLVAMGLISKITREEGSRYFSSGSSVLAGMYAKQRGEMEEAMEYLKKVQASPHSETRIRTLEGVDGYKYTKETFLSRLQAGDEMQVIGSPAKLEESMVKYFAVMHARRMEMGVRLRIIYNADVGRERIERALGWKNTDVHVLPKNKSPAWIEIYGENLMIPLFSDKIFTIAITDSAIATSFRNYFDLLWKGTKKPVFRVSR